MGSALVVVVIVAAAPLLCWALLMGMGMWVPPRYLMSLSMWHDFQLSWRVALAGPYFGFVAHLSCRAQPLLVGATSKEDESDSKVIKGSG